MGHSRPVFIHCKHNPNLVLDIYEAPVEGNRVIVWPKKHSNNANQKWIFTHDGFIANASNQNLVLDVKDHEEYQDGAELIVWGRKSEDNDNQRWCYHPEGFIYNQGSGMVLDVCEASQEPGTGLIVYHKNNSSNAHQRFEFSF